MRSIFGLELSPEHVEVLKHDLDDNGDGEIGLSPINEALLPCTMIMKSRITTHSNTSMVGLSTTRYSPKRFLCSKNLYACYDVSLSGYSSASLGMGTADGYAQITGSESYNQLVHGET